MKMEGEISSLITGYVDKIFSIINNRYNIPMSELNNIYTEVTKLKNKIITSLHEVEVSALVEVAQVLKIRVSPELIPSTTQSIESNVVRNIEKMN